MVKVYPFLDSLDAALPRTGVGSYSYRNDRYARERKHAGIDVAIARGDGIYAPNDGWLLNPDLDGTIGDAGAYGKQVAVVTEMNQRGLYVVWFFAHNSWVEQSSKYELVEAGALIARAGDTGQTFGVHSHAERYVHRSTRRPPSWTRSEWLRMWGSDHTDPYPHLAPARDVARREYA